MRISIAGLAVALGGLIAVPAEAQDLDQGRRLAQRWCAECHAIGAKPTRFRRAMPFAAIAAKDSVTTDTLSAFLLLPHATMPNVPLSRNDADDLAAFIIAMKK
jgi:mono/diheme cytochrome c family protein